MAERAVAWMCQKRRRVPYRGIEKNNAYWRMRAAAVNLRALVNLGLARTDGAWRLAPGPAV
ncbi:MAG: hypothetical protein LBU05_04795 [Bifidobacteriaceae bacterium]|jgi:hypothetical protein|nr:hypothetical protein [Bifidobacteriaceae bacterium]